jgi:uncharacterized protein YjbJ (UPF0337 family)
MNNEHIKAAGNNVKGKIKEEIGHVVGDNRMEGEGIAEQIKGKIQETVGDVKDAAKRVVDKIIHPDHQKSA